MKKLKKYLVQAAMLMTISCSIVQAGNQYDSTTCPDPSGYTKYESCTGENWTTFEGELQCFSQNPLQLTDSDPNGNDVQNGVCFLAEGLAFTACAGEVYLCGPNAANTSFNWE